MSSSLRAGLKAKTAFQHQALENELDVMNPHLSEFRYAEILERFYIIHDGFERHLRQRSQCPASRFYFDGRPKLEKIAQDLGVPGSSKIASFPRPEFVWLDSTAKVWGSIYVVEGSTLGGQIIARHLYSLPWFSKKNYGEKFFSGYGLQTGLMWQRCLENLEAIPEEYHDEVIQGASEMFWHLLHFFEKPLNNWSAELV